MRMRAHSWGWTAVVAIAACGGDGGADAPTAEADTGSVAGEGAGPALDGPLAGAQDGPVRIAGHVLIGTDRRDFQACDGGSEYWVDGPALPDLYELHERLTPGVEPFESIFVDVLAEAGPAPERGPGSQLAGTIDVLEVRRAAFEGFGCQQGRPDLIAEARGNEPFWVLTIGADEATFSTPEGDRTWTAGPLERAPEGWRIEGTTDMNEPFSLTLEVGGCSDSMSGAWSHLAATLTSAADEWTGCAWLGPAGEP